MCFTLGPLRSVTAKTMIQSACGPLVIQFFAPLRTKPPCVFSPPVTIVCASDPLIGSVSPKHPSLSPLATGSRTRFFCSSVPNL